MAFLPFAAITVTSMTVLVVIFFQAFTYGSWVKHHPAGFSLHFPAGLLPFPAMPPAAGAATAAPADARREAASTAAVSLFFIISTTLQFSGGAQCRDREAARLRGLFPVRSGRTRGRRLCGEKLSASRPLLCRGARCRAP